MSLYFNHSPKLATVAILLLAGTISPATAEKTTPQSPLKQGLNKKVIRQLLPEGFQISGRAAKLIQHPKDQRWFFQFEPEKQKLSPLSANQPASTTVTAIDPNSPDPLALPIEILPCQWLTKVTSVTNNRTDLSVTFRVWAEVTTYQKKNYILPKDVYTLSLFGEKFEKSAPKTPKPSLLGQNRAKKGSTSFQKKKFELPRQLRQILMDSPRTQPILISQITQNANSATAATPRRSFTVGGSTRSDLRENHMVVNRVGRIAYDPDEKMWLFAFESDGQSLDEPPIAILPSQLLEVVEKTLQHTRQPAKFRVSGQVTRYQNKNYFLLRKLLIVLDRGNLDK